MKIKNNGRLDVALTLLGVFSGGYIVLWGIGAPLYAHLIYAFATTSFIALIVRLWNHDKLNPKYNGLYAVATIAVILVLLLMMLP